ncbi:MAG: hypothetical protein HYZ21_11975 [Chloroflexi bacterium]|nr:hypothetical protein [Chloroflexota bacterium]
MQALYIGWKRKIQAAWIIFKKWLSNLILFSALIITAQSQAQSRCPLRSTLWAAVIYKTNPAPGTAQGTALHCNIILNHFDNSTRVFTLVYSNLIKRV